MKIVHRRNVWQAREVILYFREVDSFGNCLEREIHRVAQQTPCSPNDDCRDRKADDGVDPMVASEQNCEAGDNHAGRNPGVRWKKSRSSKSEKAGRKNFARTQTDLIDSILTARLARKRSAVSSDRSKNAKRQLHEELPKLQAEIDFLKVNSFSSDDAVYLQESWPRLEQAEKRKIVECITNKIVVSKDEITIDLCYLPASKELSKRDWSLGDYAPG